MKVWQVGVSDCEGTSLICTCATKEIALREMFKKRDQLIVEYRKMKVYSEKSTKEFLESQAKKGVFYGFEDQRDDMYDRMIVALSHDNYKEWDNYPHDVPWINEVEVLNT